MESGWRVGGELEESGWRVGEWVPCESFVYQIVYHLITYLVLR